MRARTESPALTYAGGYTSDGVVVIRHDTEIGADAQNQPIDEVPEAVASLLETLVHDASMRVATSCG